MIKFVDWGLQAYVVSREGARRLLNRCPKIVHRADHTLHAYWENGLNVVSLDPPVALHGIDGGEQSLLQEGTGNRPIRPIPECATPPLQHCHRGIPEAQELLSTGAFVGSVLIAEG